MSNSRKSRRSSILKPPKPRNPLSDVDLNPPNIDATFMKSRRVSFANSNFIKEFTADPEKNTIWHNSYEEAVVNKSEDFKNSELQQQKDTLNISTYEHDNFNCTTFGIHDNSIDAPLINSPLETSICSASIEFTASTNEMDAAVGLICDTEQAQFNEITMHTNSNLNINQKTPVCVSFELPTNAKQVMSFNSHFDFNHHQNYTNMEITGSIPANSNLMKNILKSQQQIVNTYAGTHLSTSMNFNNKENQPYFIDTITYNQDGKNDELTKANFSKCDATNSILQSFYKSANRNNTNNNNNNNITYITDDCNMEMTQTVPTSITSNTTMNMKCIQPVIENTNRTIQIEDNDMELTRIIPDGIKFAINKHYLFSNICTEPAPALRFDNNDKNLFVNMNKNETMEFTQSISSAIKITNNDLYKQQKTANFEQIMDDNDMEITEARPAGIQFIDNKGNVINKENIPYDSCITNIQVTEQNEMEFTQALPAGIKFVHNEENKINENIAYECRITDNQKIEESEMEFTQTLPMAIKFSNNDDIRNKESIALDPNIVNNQKTDENEMDFTQALPIGIKIALNSKKQEIYLNQHDFIDDETIILDDMAFIRNEKSIDKTSVSGSNNVTLNFEHNNKDPNEMKFTQAISASIVFVANNEQFTDIKVQEEHFSKAIEIQNQLNPNVENNQIEYINGDKTIKITNNVNSVSEHSDIINGAIQNINSNSDIIENCITTKIDKIISPFEHFEDTSDDYSNSTTKNENSIVGNHLEHTESESEQMMKNNSSSIFHLKGYPLILSPNPYMITSIDSNKSDICLRIQYPVDQCEFDETLNGSHQMKLYDNTNITPPSNSNKHASICINKSSFIDSTEKLINYQINFALPLDPSSITFNDQFNQDENNKRYSSENICNISNVPLKIACDDLDKEEIIENSAWKSMVEKSFINNDVLSSENVSLVNSFDNGAVVLNTENLLSISDYLNQIIKIIKDAIEDTTTRNIPNIVTTYDSSENQRKGEEFRKRFEISFKIQTEDLIGLTLEEKIKLKSKDAVWSVVQLNASVYTFSFMFETIEFVVHVAENTEIVKKIEFYSKFCESTSHPSAIYVHRIFMKKISQNYIKSALGEPYNVLSLLDIITITGEQMFHILNEFDELECRYGVVLNRDLMVKMKFFDIYLPTAFEVTVNMNNLENLTKNDICISSLVGEIDQIVVKKLIDECPQGIQQLRSFIINTKEYLKFLKSIKQKI